jgi:hypothetical protein
MAFQNFLLRIFMHLRGRVLPKNSGLYRHMQKNVKALGMQRETALAKYENSVDKSGNLGYIYTCHIVAYF